MAKGNLFMRLTSFLRHLSLKRVQVLLYLEGSKMKRSSEYSIFCSKIYTMTDFEDYLGANSLQQICVKPGITLKQDQIAKIVRAHFCLFLYSTIILI